MQPKNLYAAMKNYADIAIKPFMCTIVNTCYSHSKSMCPRVSASASVSYQLQVQSNKVIESSKAVTGLHGTPEFTELIPS
jgi:hypothetical protein